MISPAPQLPRGGRGGGRSTLGGDGGLLGRGLDEPRTALRLRGDPAPLEAAARGAAGDAQVDCALAPTAAE